MSTFGPDVRRIRPGSPGACGTISPLSASITGAHRWAIDLLGDESIQLVNVPGHTDGQAAILVHSGERFVLLAADAAYSPRNWQESITPGFGFAREWQLKSLKWIAEMASDPGCVAVLCSHDPAIAPTFIMI